MTYSPITRYTTRRVRIRWFRVAGLLAVIVAMAAAAAHRWPASSSSPPPTFSPASSSSPVADMPGAHGLDRRLRAALRRVAGDGLEFTIDSGRRSPEHQAELFREAVVKYGSEAEAARWVATPETSLHVSGDAVDIGPAAAAAWLSEHGAAYGLCQIYGNEPWHYELRREAADEGCPPMYPDPTYDPRMQQ